MKNLKKLVLLALFVGLIPQESKSMVSRQDGALLLAAGAIAWYVGSTVWNWWDGTQDVQELPAVDVISTTADVDEETLDSGFADYGDEEKETAAEQQAKVFKNRLSWTQACNACPKNSDYGFERYPARFESPFLIDQASSRIEYVQTVEKTVEALSLYMNNSDVWTDGNIRTKGDKFEPFVQRLDVPAGAQVVVHGDFHGDVHSFLKELDDLEAKGFLKKDSFEIAQDNGYMLFLGDYVDRGFYGAEVIYTICRLKLANPGRVFMVRGNHEDAGMCHDRGFGYELCQKFGYRKDSDFRRVYRLYEYLPVALYLGYNGNYIQCCHGGLEHGYDPGKLFVQDVQFDLLGHLQRSSACSHCSMPVDEQKTSTADFAPKVCIDGSTGASIGFMWHDFVKFGDSVWNNGRGLAANKELTEEVLAYQNRLIAEQDGTAQIKGIFRAHQHEFELKEDNPFNLMTELIGSYGVYKMWRGIEKVAKRPMHDGVVWTFNVAPDSMYGHDCGFGFDAYAIISPATDYNDWKMEVCNTQVVEGREFMGYVSDPGDDE